jgi:hypothetical protein
MRKQLGWQLYGRQRIDRCLQLGRKLGRKLGLLLGRKFVRRLDRKLGMKIDQGWYRQQVVQAGEKYRCIEYGGM